MQSNAATSGIWIIAIGVIAFGLYWFRDTFTQFALAVLLWFVIEAMARTMTQRLKAPRALAVPLALVAVIGATAAAGFIIADNIGAMASQTAMYERRLDSLIADIWRAAQMGGTPPSVATWLRETNPMQILSGVGRTLQDAFGDLVFIVIYLIFIFAGAAQVPKKLDSLFPREADRALARDVSTSIRESIQTYLWIQTLMSLVITGLTLATLLVIGLPNALFWALLIFFLNFIPTIGSLIAFALPTLAALAAFDELWRVAAVGIGVGAWQFIIGNFVQPRVTGESINLSTIVVLLALAIWGSLWGLAGAFLAAPLTVMIMIVLAQFPSTRWIAILLSEDGRPKSYAQHAHIAHH